MIMLKKKYNTQYGFTLIELMITILIIGLFISATIYGFNIAKQAQARALIQNITNYSTAIKRFQRTYNSLPGDYNNAYNTWPTKCVNSDCNGNANSLIEWSSTTDQVESLRAWQHLYLAGLISSSYLGTTTIAGQSIIGVNIPKSGWPYAGIELYVGATTFDGSTGNALQIAGFSNNSYASAPIMTTQDAWNLDKKIDDSFGGSGILRAFDQGSNTTCVGSDNLTYNFSITGVSCYLRYLLFP